MTPGYIIVKYPSGNSVVNIFLRDSALLENICGFFADHYKQSIKIPRDTFYHLCSDLYRESLPPEKQPKSIGDFMDMGIPESERFIECSLKGNDSDLITVSNPFENINALASNIVHKLICEYNDVMNADAVRIVPEVDISKVPYTYYVEVCRDSQGYERPYLTAKSSEGIEFAGFVCDINVIEDADE